MATSFPVLKLPDVEETIAFRAVETILQSDPLLKSTVKAWRSWKGNSEDFLGPTLQTVPYVRLTPKPGGSKWATERQHQMNLNITIQAAVAGTNSDQLMNFWGCIRRALFPNDPARLATVLGLAQGAGISKCTMTLNGYGMSPDTGQNGLRMMLAQGQIELVMLIVTP